MRWPADPYRAVLRAYDTRMTVAGAHAARHEARAAGHRADAVAAREAVEVKRLACLVSEEAGLSRAQFFDRLRMVAIARAHIAETLLHARTLADSAVVADGEAAGARARAATALGKKTKLDRWSRDQQRKKRVRAEARTEQQTQEDYACR